MNCARCSGFYSDDPLFITCPKCRRPCTDRTGGCKHWDLDLPNPRVYVNHYEAELEKFDNEEEIAE
jgi:hypothetical protein